MSQQNFPKSSVSETMRINQEMRFLAQNLGLMVQVRQVRVFLPYSTELRLLYELKKVYFTHCK